jgi:hypothetical protein
MDQYHDDDCHQCKRTDDVDPPHTIGTGTWQRTKRSGKRHEQCEQKIRIALSQYMRLFSAGWAVERPRHDAPTVPAVAQSACREAPSKNHRAKIGF